MLKAIIIVGALWAHAPVQHAPKPTLLQQAQTAAQRFWSADPCSGSVPVSFVPANSLQGGLTAVPLAPGASIDAVTLFNTPNGPNDYSEPPASYTDCAIHFSKKWSRPSYEFNNWLVFCALMVHEYGHLMGHPDQATDPPSSITYQNITSANDHLQVCRKATWQGTTLTFDWRS